MAYRSKITATKEINIYIIQVHRGSSGRANEPVSASQLGIKPRGGSKIQTFIQYVGQKNGRTLKQM